MVSGASLLVTLGLLGAGLLRRRSIVPGAAIASAAPSATSMSGGA